MLSSILSFTPDQAEEVSEYCETHSTALPNYLKHHWDWTLKNFVDADKMSSTLQGQWMIFMAQWISPKRILDVGTYSGFSALAWYEATKTTKAEIVTLELSAEMIKIAMETFKKNEAEDRIKLIEGPADDNLKMLEGEFDIVFLDADKINYHLYIKTILDKKLLSPKGIILCDNVFARGLTIGKSFNPYLDRVMRPFWETNGEALREFNKGLLKDTRIDICLIPLFDGVTQIKWKEGCYGKIDPVFY